MWDDRYAEPGFAYGAEPNDFIAEHARAMPARGRVICLASGEGRNAVWLAEQGLDVTAVDLSDVGLEKTRRLAAERGVHVHTVRADLAAFDLGEGAWDGIIMVFAHLPPPIRQRIHRSIARALRPDGAVLIEAYHKRQLGKGTGGPPVEPMLYDLDEVLAELGPLEVERAEVVYRDVTEGRYHTGDAVTIQIIARRGPSAR